MLESFGGALSFYFQEKNLYPKANSAVFPFSGFSLSLSQYQSFKPPGVRVTQILKEILPFLAIPQRLQCFIYSWSLSYKCHLFIFLLRMHQR